MAPGAFEVCTATYTTTQADVDAGKIANTAHGDRHAAERSGRHRDLYRCRSPLSRLRRSAWSKTASVPNFTAPGTVITYSYQVTNSGNVTLTRSA